MAVKLKINKGDTVEVIAGSDKGKKGVVLSVNPKKFNVLIQGVRVQTRCDKKEGQIKKEGYIDYSNVKLISKKINKASKSKPKMVAQKPTDKKTVAKKNNE